MRTRAFVRAVMAAIFAIMPASHGYAQTVAEFYARRTIELQIGYAVGGLYDIYSRVIANHIGKHIPGSPSVVAKNVEGAGSLRLANWLYNAAPKDGSVFGTIGRGVAFAPLLGEKAAQFDATKFTWLGSASDEVSLCVSWKTTGITKFQDLMTREMTVGGTGSDTDEFPKVINGVLGTRMRVVSGYPGGNAVNLAIERGEVQGRCAWSWSSLLATRPDWIRDKSVNLLVQLSLTKHPDLPDVPLVADFATTDEQRQILKLVFARQVMGRPYLAPPGIPKDRAEALQQAFMATMKDKAFLAEAEKAKLEITPVSGPDIQKLVAEAYNTPAEIAAKAAAFLR
jgi:tripartite-type tricarboxylate transporter receptor subunit TctC